MSEKIEELKETHGKEEGGQLTTLEQIWGYNELGRYNTKDSTVYATLLDDMNRPELERHARLVGVIILEDSVRLKESLKRAFANYFLLLNKPQRTNTGAVSSTSNPEVSPEVRRILAEGR